MAPRLKYCMEGVQTSKLGWETRQEEAGRCAGGGGGGWPGRLERGFWWARLHPARNAFGMAFFTAGRR